MGSSRPGIHYNAARNRWEIRGKAGKLVQAFDDVSSAKPPVNLRSFVGSSAAIEDCGSLMLAGTISGVTGLAVGDKVYANPKVALTAQVLGGFCVAAADTLNFYVSTPDGVGSMPAMSWDVFAIRTE